MTTFLLNDKVKHILREKDGIVAGFTENPEVILVDFGRGPEKTSVKYLELVSKGTDVQQALRADPAILALIWEQYRNGGRLLISCQGSVVERLASQISQITSLSEIAVTEYISAASEKTHAMKFYIMLPATSNDDFYERVSTFFGSRTTLASTKEVQYNSRSLAEWLMKEHEVLPERRT